LTYSLDNQEKNLLEDLLLNLIGLEGNYIKRSTKKTIMENSKDTNTMFKNFTLKFEIEPYLDGPTCDPSLLYMINKILPLSTYYDKICQFLNLNNNLETGLISKSFCEGIRKILREYVLFINQLENELNIENLDIQKLWYLSQPSLRMLENLQRYIFKRSNLF